MGDPIEARKNELAARERTLEIWMKEDERELKRVSAARDAEGHQFASAIKALNDNISRHDEARRGIVSELNELSMQQYQQSKQGGVGQTR